MAHRGGEPVGEDDQGEEIQRRDQDRGAGVAEGEEDRDKLAHGGDGPETGALGHEREAGLLGGPGGELPPLEEGDDDGLADGQEQRRHRERHEERHPHAKGEGAAEALVIVGGGVAGEGGERRGLERHHEDPLGEIAEALGPGEVALGPLPLLREQAPADHQVDVVDPEAQGHGGDARQHRADPAVIQVKAGAHLVARRPERRPLGHDLEGPAHEGPDAQGEGRVVPRGAQQRREAKAGDDQRHVEERRGKGGGEEAAAGVQRRHAEGRRAHEEDVREDQPREVDGASELLRALAEPPGEEIDEPGRPEDPGHRDQRQDQQRQAADPGVEGAGGALPVLLLDLGEHRHDGAADGALGQELPQGVGQGEGDPEGVRVGHGEHRRHADVARQPEEPRGQGAEGDDASPGGDLPLLGLAGRGVDGLAGGHSRGSSGLSSPARSGSMATSLRARR